MKLTLAEPYISSYIIVKINIKNNQINFSTLPFNEIEAEVSPTFKL